MKSYILIAVVGYVQLFGISISTRAVSKDSDWALIGTSLIAGSCWWMALWVALPNLKSWHMAIIYVLFSTAGRYSAFKLYRYCEELNGRRAWRRWIERKTRRRKSEVV